MDNLSKFGPNAGYIYELYQLYLKDAALVGDSWANFFSQIENDSDDTGLKALVPQRNGHYSPTASDAKLEIAALNLIHSFRAKGHLLAKSNPLSQGVSERPPAPECDPGFYNLDRQALQLEVSTHGFSTQPKLKLHELLSALQRVYCASIGFEFMHLPGDAERDWLRSRLEVSRNLGIEFSTEQKLRILNKLICAEGFEAELNKKYVGVTRFSAQGGESIIAMLDVFLNASPDLGFKEVVIGMAHRARLNVLLNTMNKPLVEMISEFEDRTLFAATGAGDVKYHMDYTSVHNCPDQQQVKLYLAPNPSHLEFVNPIVEGVCRAKQDLLYHRDRRAACPVLIHGDASFCGQGIVYETLNFSNVEGYTTAGTVHVVLNNQVGFTTDAFDSRSSLYCTDMAKAIGAPVFHVNAEDVEACCRVMLLAGEYRSKFGRDVVIDLIGYRKYGHNEGDDPTFTQSLMYAEIKKKQPVYQIYATQLRQLGVVSEQDLDQQIKDFAEQFERAYQNRSSTSFGEACPMHGRLRVPTHSTGVEKSRLKQIIDTLVDYPEGFTAHPKLKQIFEKRLQVFNEGKGIDWGFAEALAFGTLVLDGHGVRLSGQDCGRGTFGQRHLVVHDFAKNECYLPFDKLTPNMQAKFEVYNSTLSEAGVMGFEFGYASVARDALVLWEAQYGDFCNGAQVIIDQFIASSEAQWGQLSGLVLLLPHGYEGQGPEHSSARLERFLRLCAEGNIIVAYPSTAAQYFHLLRRQGSLQIKRPLIVMTPKSLLRKPEVSATLEQLTSGQFRTVIVDDIGEGTGDQHVIITTGKMYHEIRHALKDVKNASVKIIRIEQLYPFPQYEIKKALKDIKAKSCFWVQEEPLNMGAWSYMDPYFRIKLKINVDYVGRPVSASTATGSHQHHAIEQKRILEEVVTRVSV